MKKKLKVVAAIIENEKNEILCALRSKNMSLGGFWEFPGGKIEAGETPADAIIREISEELNCTISCDNKIFNDTTYEYDNFIINLLTIKCVLMSGTPIANEHTKLIWLEKDYLESLNWAPADIPAVKQLIK